VNKRTKALVLLTLGVGWLVADLLWLIVSNVSLRETRLGVIAQLLDKLPPGVANPIFIFLWIAMLLGWLMPLVMGFRPLLRSQSAS